MLIKDLKLYTNNLNATFNFYSRKLNFTLANKSKTSISFNVGDSLLTFQLNRNATPYHFALTIPSNQVDSALDWLESSGIKPIHKSFDFVFHNEDWNTRSIYFYDSDKNLVELIARDNLSHNLGSTFSPDSIFGINEIVLATGDVAQTYAQLSKHTTLMMYDGNLVEVAAVGSESSLIILANPNYLKLGPNQDTMYTSSFQATLKIGCRLLNINYVWNQLEIDNFILR